MPDAIAPLQQVTFTIKKAPDRVADRKTIRRLMRLQPEIQNGLKKLARRRRQTDNRPYIRAGVIWVDRKKTTKLTRIAAGETFTIFVTPQLLPDIRSVEKYLEAKAA